MIELFRATRLLIASGLVIVPAVFQACGGDDDAGPGGSGGTGNDASADGPTNCEPVGATCAAHDDCCSANCDPRLKVCANGLGRCKGSGEGCAAPTECCTMVCDGGRCGSTQCTSDNQPCTSAAQCCSGTCTGSVCQPLNAECKTSGNTCSGHGDCCSHFCENGKCSGQPSFCLQSGDACGDNDACCTGICTKQAGAAVGTCTPPSAPGTTGCLVAGQVCGAGATADGGVRLNDAGIPACGGECCSRSCAPYGPTGVLVCQPPSGCRPTGEVCREDADCCGSPGLPGGNGSVRCSKGPGEPVGRCDNGNACRPAGAVCKLATSSCNAENNCCAGNVNQNPEVCQQDLLGIPRCTGAGSCAESGSRAGQACSNSADCCGLPCLPNAGGGYVCGGTTCVPSNGACTTDADCCSGLPCRALPGSTQGVCGAVDIPDSGYDAGNCAFYGQTCTTGSDCCNNVPCNNGRCVQIVQ
jgi:hypothetical protein